MRIASSAIVHTGPRRKTGWMPPIRAARVISAASILIICDGRQSSKIWLIRNCTAPSRVVPGMGGYDWASLIGAFLIVLLASSVFFLAGWPVQLVLLVACERFLSWILYGFMALLVIEVIFSWINPHAPLAPVVRALNEPLLRPIRKVVPLIGNLDLSVLVALILLQIAQLLLGLAFNGR